MRKKLLALTMALLLFFGSFTYPLKVEATEVEVITPNMLNMTELHKNTLQNIVSNLRAELIVQESTRAIEITKDGVTYIVTNLEELNATIYLLSGGAASVSMTFGTVAASSLAFYFTYAVTVEMAKVFGFTDNATMNGLNDYLVSKLMNPSTEVQAALNEVLFAALVSKGANFEIPRAFTKLMFEFTRDFFNFNYRPGDLNFVPDGIQVRMGKVAEFDQYFQKGTDVAHNGYSNSHFAWTNKDTGAFFYLFDDTKIAYYTELIVRTWWSATGANTAVLKGYEYVNGVWKSTTTTIILDNDRGRKDGDRKPGVVGETGINKALNVISEFGGYLIGMKKLGSLEELRNWILENKGIEPPVLEQFAPDLDSSINQTIDDFIDLFEENPTVDIADLPSVNASNSTNDSLTAQDIANNESITNIQQDTDYSPQKVPVPETGTGSGNGNGNENETDDKVNWEKLKNIGTAFTNVFPFSIPWDFLRIYKGVFNGTKPKEIHFPYKIAGYDFGITITAQVMSFFGVARILIRLLADLGLLLLIHKWMGAQK